MFASVCILVDDDEAVSVDAGLTCCIDKNSGGNAGRIFCPNGGGKPYEYACAADMAKGYECDGLQRELVYKCTFVD